ncbi:hypothetical protein N0V90_004061 [Kalmusia sp. IMI 367209]|nr:hypothetical protein N0V90_004061 [Kalmusia sp. IMI 367209]
MTQLIWPVTGCSSGFGEVFVRIVLARGDRATATARGDVARLALLENAGAAVLSLDATASQYDINAKVEEAIAIYGRIDVIINNAGYIEAGIAEEVTFIAQFNTNPFGSINTTRALSPHSRANKSGVIVYIGSLGAIAGEIGGAAYCASKFALQGRTQADSNQPGNSEKAVNIMIDIVKEEGVAEGKTQSLRFPIGKDALAMLRNKYIKYLELCNEWEDMITSTDYDVPDTKTSTAVQGHKAAVI